MRITTDIDPAHFAALDIGGPASDEEIVAHFRSYDRDRMWADNWAQDDTAIDAQVPWRDTSIQGVLCYLDRDVTGSWLLMILDTGAGHRTPRKVSYLATTSGTWASQRIDTDDHFTACRTFLDWVQATDPDEPFRR